jgi:hypothetical protein
VLVEKKFKKSTLTGPAFIHMVEQVLRTSEEAGYKAVCGTGKEVVVQEK